jgi:hypothetical protein
MQRLLPILCCTVPGWLLAADWAVPAAARRYTLARASGQAEAVVGRVQVWPQSDGERSAQVVGANGRPVGTRLLWQSPGQPMEVWFDAAAAGPTPQIYVGSNFAPANWDPPAGLALEIRSRVNQPADTAEQILAQWDTAAPIQGRTWAERIFHGTNPFGPSEELLARYTGWISVPSAGAWKLATVSDDGSVLLVDGKQVVAWAGWHGAEEGMRGEHHATVQLSSGRHRIDYRVVQGGGGFCAAIAWQPPGGTTWEMVPASAFAGCTRYEAQRPETPRGADWAVSWRIEQHAAPGTDAYDPCLIQMRLELDGPVGTATWVMDDAARYNARLVEHWWLRPGQRTVQIEFTPQGGQAAQRSLGVQVHPSWMQAGPMPDDKPGHWRRIVRDRAATVPPADLVAAVRLVLAADETGSLAEAAAFAAPRAAALAEADPETALALALRIQGAELRRYREAATLLQAVAERKHPAAARARLHLGGMLLAVDGDRTAAAEVWRGIVASDLDDGDKRLLAVFRADALFLGGEVEAARAAYRALPAVADAGNREYALRRRLRLELARDRLSQGRWADAEQSLREIEWETPLERMGDETGLLLMRIWLTRGELQLARTRGRMLRAVGDGPRASEVLLTAAKVELAAKDGAAAKILIAQLRAEHPFSEAAAQAAEIGSIP